MQSLDAPLTDIHCLTEAEWFVVRASRVFRETNEQKRSTGAHLPQLFAAAQLTPALPAFVRLLVALSADPTQTLNCEDSGALEVGAGERGLLQAIFNWQQRCLPEPQQALWFIPGRAIRRVASDAGRVFALEMAASGLLLPQRPDRPLWTPTDRMVRGQSDYRVH